MVRSRVASRYARPMLPHKLATSLAALTLGGCAFFAALAGQDPNQTNEAAVDPAEQERLRTEQAASAQQYPSKPIRIRAHFVD